MTIPSERIQVVSASDVSIMPQGMTQTLRRDELVDLVRFLSELGRPGPYRSRTERFVRSWRKLEPTAAASRSLAGEADAIAMEAETLSWSPTTERS